MSAYFFGEVFDVEANLCRVLLTILDDDELYVIQLHYWGELTEREIGEQLGEGRDRVHHICRRARLKMRRHSDALKLTPLVQAALYGDEEAA